MPSFSSSPPPAPEGEHLQHTTLSLLRSPSKAPAEEDGLGPEGATGEVDWVRAAELGGGGCLQAEVAPNGWPLFMTDGFFDGLTD